MKAVVVTSLMGIVSCVSLGQPVWSPTGGPEGGGLTDVVEWGGVMFASVGSIAQIGGVVRSVDGGASWEELGVGARSQVVDLDLLGGTVVAATAGGSLFASSDQGDTWVSFAVPGHDAPGELFEIGASGGALYVMFLPEGEFLPRLWKTLDLGQTWEQLPIPAVPLYSFHAVGDVLMGGALFGNMFARSVDGGQTWQASQSSDFGLPGSASLFSFETLSDGSLMVASYGHFDGANPSNGVWRSFDDGASWSKVTGGEIPDTHRGIDVYESGSGILALTELGDTYVWRSRDDGETWDNLGVIDTDSFPQVAQPRICEVGGAMTVSTGWIGVLRSVDDGMTWARSNRGLAKTVVHAIAASDDGMYASLGDQDVWRLRDGAWDAVGLPGGFQYVNELYESADGVVFAGTGYDGIYRSFDGGESWAQSNTGVPIYNGSAGEQWREVGAFVGQDSAIYAGLGVSLEFIAGQFRLTGGGALRSTNGGDSWQAINAGLPILGRNDYNEPVRDPMISGVSAGGTVYMGMLSSGVYAWAGSGWQAASQGLPSNSSVHTMAADDSYVYCAATFGTVFRRALEENVWTPAGALPGFVLGLHARGDGVYASLHDGTQGPGVYVSTDHGQNWERYGDGFPSVPGAALTSRCGMLYAATSGSSVWSAPVRCPGDVDGDGETTTLDVLAFLNAWSGGGPCGDFNGDGAVNTLDVLGFLNAWSGGC